MNKKIQVLTIFSFLTILTFFNCQPSSPNHEISSNQKSDKNKTAPKKERLLRHVVLFKFKKESTPEEINQLNEAFNALPAAIPVIKDFEWGINDSPEDFHQDFTHCYLLTFESEEDRDSIYAPHPAHKAFGESLGPHLEGVLVVDYWTNP